MPVLVFATAARLSVHHACAPLERAPSAPTVLGPLACQLSDLNGLEGHVKALLARLIPQGLGKCGRQIAIEVIALTSYGPVDEAQRDEVCRSKVKDGTIPFFPYATTCAVSEAAGILWRSVAAKSPRPQGAPPGLMRWRLQSKATGPPLP